MKRILAGLALVILAGSFSFALEPVTVTIDSVSSSMTVRGIDISSSVPTSVIVSTTPLFRQVCVQNISTSTWLACGDNVKVSTITTGDGIGVVIPAAPTITTPYTPTCFSVVAGNHYYCLHSADLNGTSRAVIIRGR